MKEGKKVITRGMWRSFSKKAWRLIDQGFDWIALITIALLILCVLVVFNL